MHIDYFKIWFDTILIEFPLSKIYSKQYRSNLLYQKLLPVPKWSHCGAYCPVLKSLEKVKPLKYQNLNIKMFCQGFLLTLLRPISESKVNSCKM